jgi:hypothetical protein
MRSEVKEVKNTTMVYVGTALDANRMVSHWGIL